MGVFIKFTVQTLNAQLSEWFTDHQRVQIHKRGIFVHNGVGNLNFSIVKI